jgi:protein SCO1/2
VALALVGLALVATYVAVLLRAPARAPAHDRVEAAGPGVLGQVPEFALLDQNGRAVTGGTLAGEPWVASFVFTRCALACPRLTSLMIRLGADAPGVRRVSVSVDPEHDTPQVLADYAAAHGVDDPSWLFLTGGRGDVEALVVEGFKLPIVRQPPPELADPAEPILHSNRFVLVDGGGAIRGYYEATEREEYARLLADLASLGNGARSPVGAVAPGPLPPGAGGAESATDRLAASSRGAFAGRGGLS